MNPRHECVHCWGARTKRAYWKAIIDRDKALDGVKPILKRTLLELIMSIYLKNLTLSK